MGMNELKYLLALNKIPTLPARFKKFLSHFGSVKKIWSAEKEELMAIPNIRKDTIDAFLKHRDKINLNEECEKVIKNNIKILTILDKNYPENLKNIFDPPIVLYMMGDVKEEDKNSIAIVGSRLATIYGKEVSKNLSFELAKRGITVISGFARGIDTSAHIGAIEGKGRTIAVIGSGIDIIYPKENKELYQKIPKYGAIISEFPLNTPPYATNFPRRNRMISGLSLGVVVVEAKARSGASITANFALEQGKELFAVPGDVRSQQSVGPHRLIKEGAKLVEDIKDILEEFGIRNVTEEIERKREEVLPEIERVVLNCLSLEPKHIEDIIKETLLPTASVNSALLILEMKGLIKQYPGKMFTR